MTFSVDKSFSEFMETLEIGDNVKVIFNDDIYFGKVIIKLYSKHINSNLNWFYPNYIAINVCSTIIPKRISYFSKGEFVSYSQNYEMDYQLNIDEFFGQKILWMHSFSNFSIEKINE